MKLSCFLTFEKCQIALSQTFLYLSHVQEFSLGRKLEVEFLVLESWLGNDNF